MLNCVTFITVIALAFVSINRVCVSPLYTLFTSRIPEMPFTLECSIVYYSAIWMGDLAIFGVLIDCDMELLFDKFIDDYLIFLLIHE